MYIKIAQVAHRPIEVIFAQSCLFYLFFCLREKWDLFYSLHFLIEEIMWMSRLSFILTKLSMLRFNFLMKTFQYGSLTFNFLSFGFHTLAEIDRGSRYLS